MHIFIDTNILLSFYHFTGDDLDALDSVFISHKKGAAIVHLTDQVKDEFKRNRETKIGDALKRFKGFNLSELPYFMKTYREYENLQEISKRFKKEHAALLRKAEDDVKNEKLIADQLIGGIFKRSKLLKTTQAIYERARMRVDIGNPPGKNGSIGDAINWLLLLEHVPNGQDLYIVTEDSDFYSSIDEGQINSFLRGEWSEKKESSVQCYRTLRDFLKDHYDGVLLSFDPKKKGYIDELENSGSFAETHAIVAKLNEYDYFSMQEVTALLDAALANNQFGWIVADEDVKDLLRKAILPHTGRLKEKKYKELIDSVSDDD